MTATGRSHLPNFLKVRYIIIIIIQDILSRKSMKEIKVQLPMKKLRVYNALDTSSTNFSGFLPTSFGVHYWQKCQENLKKYFHVACMQAECTKGSLLKFVKVILLSTMRSAR